MSFKEVVVFFLEAVKCTKFRTAFIFV